MRSKSSRAAVLVGLRRHLSSNSSLACSRNSFTVSAASTFLFDDDDVVALLPIFCVDVLALVLVLAEEDDGDDVKGINEDNCLLMFSLDNDLFVVVDCCCCCTLDPAPVPAPAPITDAEVVDDGEMEVDCDGDCW